MRNIRNIRAYMLAIAPEPVVNAAILLGLSGIIAQRVAEWLLGLERNPR